MYERQMAEVYNWCCRAKAIHNVSVNIISFSNFSNSLLHFRHKIGEATISLLTGNPNTDDSLPATICPLETFPSNKLNFSQPEIKTSPLQTRQKFLVSTEEVRRAFNGVFFSHIPWKMEMFSDALRCATWQLGGQNRSETIPAWNWGSRLVRPLRPWKKNSTVIQGTEKIKLTWNVCLSKQKK